MLHDLRLKNFKIWKTTGLMQLAPVTLLLGTNSSGKSTIIQSLLLIRQTVRSNDPNSSLHFGTEGSRDSVALGQFSDVLCRHGSDRKIGIEFSWSTTGPDVPFQFSAEYQPTPTDAAEIFSLRLGRQGQGFTVTRQQRGAYRLSVGVGRKTLRATREIHPQNSFTFSPATFAKMPSEDGMIIREAGDLLLL